MSTDLMDTHAPSPQFRDFLEDEVTFAYRRQRNFARLRVVALVVASLAVGTTAGLASAQISESAQRDSLLEVARSDLALMAMRLELAEARLSDVSSRVKVGALHPSSLASAETELRSMQASARRAQLNIEEISATAQAPRDDLNAPLVRSRDYVTERLQLDLLAAQQRLASAEQMLAETDRRFRVGAGSEVERLDAGVEVARARGLLGTLAERRTLRREFVEKGTRVEQLNLRLLQAQLRFDAYAAQEAFKAARARLELLRKQRAVGAVQELDVLRAEVEMREREMELATIARQLRQLGIPR